mgnify:CR=1 FL=1
MTLSFILTGVTFSNAKGHSRQQILQWSNPGDPVRLEREKDNPHDPNAIRVIALKHGVTMGYVPKDLAAVFVAERKFPAVGRIEEIFGGTDGKPHLGCRINVEFRA